MNLWTKLPNEILEVMPDMSKAELKLTMLLVSQTYGHLEAGRHRTEARMTYDDMHEMTNLARGSISKAIDLVEKRGFFWRGRRSTWYAAINLNQSLKSELNNANESVQEIDQNSSESRLSQVDDSLKNEPPIYKREKKERERSAPAPSLLSSEWFKINEIDEPRTEQERENVKHPAVKVWLEITDRWPSYRALPYIIRDLGIQPDRQVLAEVWDLWQVNGWKKSNVSGVLERYKKVVMERPKTGGRNENGALAVGSR
jgi:hypothetical protein